MLDASVCKTCGLVYYLFDIVNNSRADAKIAFGATWLKRVALCAVTVVNSSDGGRAYMTEDGQSLTFNSAGACNLESDLASVHGAVRTTLKESWTDMKNQGKVSTEFTSASIMDLVCFVSSVLRQRRENKKRKWSLKTMQLFDLMFWALNKFLSAVINQRCQQIKMSLGDRLLDRRIPSRSLSSNSPNEPGPQQAQVVPRESDDDEPEEPGAAAEPKRKARTRVNLNEIWRMYSSSVEINGITLSMLLRTKENDEESGVKRSDSQESTTSIWCVMDLLIPHKTF